VKLGKLPYRQDDRTLLISNHITSLLPPAPPTLDLTAKVNAWPLYSNDKLSDCTCFPPGTRIRLADGTWAVLPASWKSKAPHGFDFKTLQSDLAQLGQVQPLV
jgi:hypothetical protein